MQETLCLSDCSSFSTLKYLRRILCKIRHFYSTIHQLCSNSYQLVNIFVIINRLFFHTTVFIHPIFESTGIINSPCIFFSRLNTFKAIDIQPPNNALFLRLMFSTSPIDFEKFFYGIRYCFKSELVFLTWNVFNKSFSLFIVR